MSDPVSDMPRLDGFADWSPDAVVLDAVAEFDPIASFCLLSGGNDSTVLAHRCHEHYDELVHIDTGTAVPGVREFVESFAEWLDKPLRVLEAGDAYRVLVLGGLACRSGDETPPLGFPGPANHTIAYTRIKERRIEALTREVKEGHPRRAKIMLLSGTRRHESQRRMRTQANRYRCRGAQLWVNPLLDWTDAQMAAYREAHDLPQSDVAALLHRSGECNCGSFASPGEREMLRSLWPEWFEATIGELEREATRLGLAACRWGERPPAGAKIVNGRRAEMCSDCVLVENRIRIGIQNFGRHSVLHSQLKQDIRFIVPSPVAVPVLSHGHLPPPAIPTILDGRLDWSLQLQARIYETFLDVAKGPLIRRHRNLHASAPVRGIAIESVSPNPEESKP